MYNELLKLKPASIKNQHYVAKYLFLYFKCSFLSFTIESLYFICVLYKPGVQCVKFLLLTLQPFT